MEFVEGGSLAARLDGTPWDGRRAAAFVAVLAEAMHYAHERGVVHRDLKPGNVLLAPAPGSGPAGAPPAGDRGFAPKVTDFGLAKRLEGGESLTQTGVVLGTPSYMAPEQAAGKGQGISPATDVYALGAVLYELLTGRPPFQAATPLDTVLQVLHEEPVPPRQRNAKVDPDLEAVCLKCLAKAPPERHASAAALAEDLRRFLAGDRPVHARPLGEWESAARWARKHPITAALTALAVAPLLFLYLVETLSLYLASTTLHGAGIYSGPYLPVIAGVPGFLATMAILVRPRRRIVRGSVLVFGVALGLLCSWFWVLGKTPDASSVLFGLAFGVIPAGLFGGISRWIARRYRCDMLSVFFGGVIGAAAALMLFTGGRFRSLDFVYLAGGAVPPTRLAWIIGVLLTGFCLGATAVVHFSRSRRGSE